MTGPVLLTYDAGVQDMPNSSRHDMGTSGKGMVLPFQPLSLTFYHMDYYVKLPKVGSALMYE